MPDMFKPFSMKEIWKSWSNSGEAFENATKKFAEAKDKMSSVGKSMVESKESKRIKDLTSQISALNMELASAMTEYTTRALTGKLTPLDSED